MIQLQISGMNCQHCVNAVQEALSGVAGVTRVIQVDLDSGRASIEGSADTQALIAAVEQAGYQASLA